MVPKNKTTWINTLSFLVTVADSSIVTPLLKWIIDNDQEVLIRFESGRLDKNNRIAVFKSIFENYTNKQIWVISNKFSNQELAAFGNYKEIFEYLIEILESSAKTRIVKLNALHILDNFDLVYYSEYKERLRTALLAMLQVMNAANTEKDFYGIQSILSSLATLGITDKTTVQWAVNQYRKNTNQHIRAGLYKLIHHSDFVNNFVDVFIEGLDVGSIPSAIPDRENVNLMDETFHLQIGLEKISSTEGLLEIMKRLSNPEKQRGLYISDLKKVIQAFVINAIAIYEKSPEIYNSVIEFYKKGGMHYNREITQLILPFFEKTGTQWQAFQFFWKKADESGAYELAESNEYFINTEVIQKFLTGFNSKDYTESDIAKLYDILLWNRYNSPTFEGLISTVDAFALEHSITLPEKPERKDWNTINKIRTQTSFDLLFDDSKLLEEATSIFSNISKVELNDDDLYGLRSENYRNPEDSFVLSALELLRDHTINRSTVTLPEISGFIGNKSLFIQYKIDKVYTYLHGNNNIYIELTTDQENTIRAWCMDIPMYDHILWFFLQKFKPSLTEEKLLSLTLHFDYTSHAKVDDLNNLDILEGFVSPQKIKDKVVSNIKAGINDYLIWAANASYAIRHNLSQTYQNLLKYMEGSDALEYKIQDILIIWFEKTKDISRMQSFIENVINDYLKWKAISIYFDYGREQEFLKQFLLKVMNNPEEKADLRIKAGNYLIAMGVDEGFGFVASYILDRPDPKVDFQSTLQNIHLLTEAKYLPTLMKLMYVARQDDFQKDNFNNLERLILQALRNIGIQSDLNFSKVKIEIETFINKFGNELKSLNFLQFQIDNIEAQLNLNQSKNFTIADALAEFERVK